MSAFELGRHGQFDPIFDIFGTPTTAFEFDTTSLTGLTALSTTPDVENADTTVPGHYYLRDDNNTGANKVMGRYAAVTPPFTAITLARSNQHSANIGMGLFLGEATPGILEVLGWYNSPTGGQGTRYALVIRYSNPTTFSSAPATYVTAHIAPPLYFALCANSSTDIDYLYSYDGYLWIPLLLARNPSITIASAGICMDCASSSPAEACAFDYLRIWNSALTFPGIA